MMAKLPLSVKTASDATPEAALQVASEAAPELTKASVPLFEKDAAFFDTFFSEILPVLGGGAFYQPSAWEHYAKAELSYPGSGVHQTNGWEFTFEDGKLLFAEKLPENATSGLTE
jgi:hypothetical protein